MTNLADPTTAPKASSPESMTFGRRLIWLGPTGIVVAVALSVLIWMQVRSIEDNGSLAAAAFALLMTAPVVLARRWPIPAATAIALGAVLNPLVFPDMVRCAAAVPAALYVAFAVGARSREGGAGWARPIAGLLIVLANLLAQYVWDRVLHADSFFLAFGGTLAVLAWGAGIGWSYLARRRSSRLVVANVR